MDIDELKQDMQKHPESYTVWARSIFEKCFHHIQAHKL